MAKPCSAENPVPPVLFALGRPSGRLPDEALPWVVAATLHTSADPGTKEVERLVGRGIPDCQPSARGRHPGPGACLMLLQQGRRFG